MKKFEGREIFGAGWRVALYPEAGEAGGSFHWVGKEPSDGASELNPELQGGEARG